MMPVEGLTVHSPVSPDAGVFPERDTEVWLHKDCVATPASAVVVTALTVTFLVTVVEQAAPTPEDSIKVITALAAEGKVMVTEVPVLLPEIVPPVTDQELVLPAVYPVLV